MQIDAEIWSLQSDKEKLSCLRGESLYKEITQSGQTSLAIERVQALTDNEIYCLLIFSIVSDLNFEKDTMAYEVIDQCLKVHMERRPLKIDKEAAYERFKRMMKDEFGCTLNDA